LSSIEPPEGSRADCLLSIHQSRLAELFLQLPQPLKDLARSKRAFRDFQPETDLYSSRDPAASPWLFWETFSCLEDDTFLQLAGAGAVLYLSSIVLDHLVDGHLVESGATALLYKALYDRGVSTLQDNFPRTSEFWAHFERLNAEHLSGLAAEVEARTKPEVFTRENMIVMAQGKVCPGVMTIAAMAEASGQQDVLRPVEKSLKNLAVASQLIDDVQDWESDVEVGHLTYFLACLVPVDDWVAGERPSIEELQQRINDQWIDVDHWREAMYWHDRAIELMHDIFCPTWTDHVHDKRTLADKHREVAIARHLTRELRHFAPKQATHRSINLSAEPKKSSTRVPRMDAVLDEAVRSALEAVLTSQSDDGSWVDFDLPTVGASDAWVTAHVGLKLATLPELWSNDSLGDALEAAAKFLYVKWHHGWGYNDSAPVDADSTAHALLMLNATGSKPPTSTIDALLSFQYSDGGFATYTPFRSRSMPQNWLVSHPDVTPIVVRALAPYSTDPRVADAINRAMRRMDTDRLSDGTWPSFWWKLRWYTASAWVNAAISIKEPLSSIHWHAGRELNAEWTTDLDAAHLLECSMNIGRIDIAEQVAQHLLRNQLEDGSWLRAPVLRQPKPGVHQPWNAPDDEICYADVSGVYSTATILSAIAKWMSYKSGDS